MTISSVSGVDSSVLLQNYIAQQQQAAAASNTATAASSNNSTSISKMTGDFNTFLKILTTQLQNQDPMNATDTNQFTQELVQFSGVEQQINSNSKLDQLIALAKGNAITPLLNYVGMTVETPANDKILVQNGASALAYTLPGTAQNVTLTVKDSSGSVLATMGGPTTSGVNRVAWDGVKTDGTQAADGLYTLTVAATDSSGSAMTVGNIDMIGKVTGLQTASDGTATLSMGSATIKDSAITAVYGGVATASNTGNNSSTATTPTS